MKFRNGFVSNSSSSSFVILKRELNLKQINQIINHQKECIKYNMSCSNSDEWAVSSSTKMLSCNTDMDNFDMNEFLCYIGVKPHSICWKY